MAKRPGMRIKLRGKSWQLSRVINLKVRGDIDSAEVSHRRIRIASRVKDGTEELLEVVIHECLHGLFWDMGEEAINQAGIDLAKILTRLGAEISLPKSAEVEDTD
tara:strand:+ start:301 stop:615 length:315 start_codon:yes stop_codon:yes gene_type:complete